MLNPWPSQVSELFGVGGSATTIHLGAVLVLGVRRRRPPDGVEQAGCHTPPLSAVFFYLEL